jgi:hypothetical protein
MQRIIENGVIVLTADDGMILTDNSSFGTVVRLGKEADESVWYEITVEEAERRIAEITTEDDATDEDYQSALREMGVKV